MATPSSSASIESSPNPSTNSGASLSISFGVMSSSASTSIIIRLISSSNGRMDVTFLGKKIAQRISDMASRQNVATRLHNKRLDIDVVFYFDAKLRSARRKLPPANLSSEHHRAAADQHG